MQDCSSKDSNSFSHKFFTYEEILVIFRDCTEFLIDSDNDIRIVLMIVEFMEYIEFKGVLRRSS